MRTELEQIIKKRQNNIYNWEKCIWSLICRKHKKCFRMLHGMVLRKQRDS